MASRSASHAKSESNRRREALRRAALKSIWRSGRFLEQHPPADSRSDASRLYLDNQETRPARARACVQMQAAGCRSCALRDQSGCQSCPHECVRPVRCQRVHTFCTMHAKTSAPALLTHRNRRTLSSNRLPQCCDRELQKTEEKISWSRDCENPATRSQFSDASQDVFRAYERRGRCSLQDSARSSNAFQGRLPESYRASGWNSKADCSSFDGAVARIRIAFPPGIPRRPECLPAGLLPELHSTDQKPADTDLVH